MDLGKADQACIGQFAEIQDMALANQAKADEAQTDPIIRAHDSPIVQRTQGCRGSTLQQEPSAHGWPLADLVWHRTHPRLRPWKRSVHGAQLVHMTASLLRFHDREELVKI